MVIQTYKVLISIFHTVYFIVIDRTYIYDLSIHLCFPLASLLSEPC